VKSVERTGPNVLDPYVNIVSYYKHIVNLAPEVYVSLAEYEPSDSFKEH